MSALRTCAQLIYVQDEAEESHNEAVLRLEVDLSGFLRSPHIRDCRLGATELGFLGALLRCCSGLGFRLDVLNGREHLSALHAMIEGLRGPGVEVALRVRC